MTISIALLLACSTSSRHSQPNPQKSEFQISDIDTAKAAARLFVRVVDQNEGRPIAIILPFDAPAEVGRAFEGAAPIVQINETAREERVAYAYVQRFVATSEHALISVNLSSDSHIDPKCLRGAAISVDFSCHAGVVTLGSYTVAVPQPLC